MRRDVGFALFITQGTNAPSYDRDSRMPKSTPSRSRNSGQKSGKSPANPSSAFQQAVHELRHSPSAFPNISGRWLLAALASILVVGLACAWLTLCLLYWQGSWQLLYHPKAEIAATPARIGLPFEPVKFAATETGTNQLTGWWLPAENPGFTVLYLHGADGNLGNTLNMLAALHRQNLNVFAIDYRGYGQSLPARPSEKQLRQDAEWSLTWLTVTRQIPAKTVIVAGTGLGANLAAEIAADHPELAGTLLDDPLQNAVAPVFDDSRSRLVPAHWLVKDRYDLNAAASALHTPSLWIFANTSVSPSTQVSPAYRTVPKKKSAAWLTSPSTADPKFAETVQRWLDDL